MCRKPFNRVTHSFGCGQCMPCRFNRRRIWSHRLMLEALVHSSASFVTLTYNNDNLPVDGSVSVRALQLFMKRLRKNVGVGIRFFGVGEYGDFSWRPHYHLALYGLGREASDIIARSWGLGFSYVGDLTLDSAQYVAGYVTKKMTKVDDERLDGRYPEFARMSLRPGIGAPAIEDVAAALQNKHGWDEIGRLGDVPGMLRHGRKSLPLGRYMRLRLRQAMNFEILKESDEAAFRRSAQMLDVYKNYLLDTEVGAVTGAPLYSLGKERHAEADTQRVAQMEAKSKIYSSKKGVGV